MHTPRTPKAAATLACSPPSSASAASSCRPASTSCWRGGRAGENAVGRERPTCGTAPRPATPGQPPRPPLRRPPRRCRQRPPGGTQRYPRKIRSRRRWCGCCTLPSRRRTPATEYILKSSGNKIPPLTRRQGAWALARIRRPRSPRARKGPTLRQRLLTVRRCLSNLAGSALLPRLQRVASPKR